MLCKLNYSLFLAISLGCASIPAVAADIPISIGSDKRVTTVAYKDDDVVELVVKPGIATHIVLQAGEEYEAHAFGDSEAWHFSSYKNNLFIKPAQPMGTTNLSVITNKRTYVFKVNFISEGSDLTDMFQVKFIYPNEINQAEVEANNKAEIENRLDDAKTQKVFNLNYTMKGGKTIAPINVWDDGTFTYFKFAGNTDMPAIYSVALDGSSANGQETLVNKTIEGSGNDIAVMHKVSHLWRLRLGREVLDIRNDSMNWYGTLNKSGTIANDVERVEIGGGE